MAAHIFSMAIVIICVVDAQLTTTIIQNKTYKLNEIQVLNEKKNEDDEIYITNMTLEEVCEILNIPTTNCSCNGKIMTVKDVCDLLNSQNNKNVLSCDNLKEMKEVCNLFYAGDNENITFSCDNISDKVIGISNILSSTLALIGNAFVIWVSLTQHNEFTRFNQLVISLAISDFIFAAVQLIMSVTQTWTCQWVYGLVLCKILRAALAASANIAIGFIVIIAIERYIGTVHLFSSILNTTRFQVMICLNIVFGILSVVPPLKVLQLDRFNKCSEEWSRKNSRVYSWLLFLFYYTLPIVLMSVLYTVMVVWLRKSFFKSNILNDIAQKSRLIKNKKILLILILILVMFATLTLPNRIVWIINDTYSNLDNKIINQFLKMFSEIPYGFHAAVNPIIYSIVDIRFRQRLKYLLGIGVSALIRSSTLTLSHILHQSNTQVRNTMNQSNTEVDNISYRSHLEIDNISYRSHLEVDNISYRSHLEIDNISFHSNNINIDNILHRSNLE